MTRIEIPMKLPSLNEYVNACRTKYIVGSRMKAKVEKDITPFINKLPKFEKKIRIKFIWVEANDRRDLDNICFAKKFILDAMVKAGKIPNDNRKYVDGFIDEFPKGNETKVILEISEADE